MEENDEAAAQGWMQYGFLVDQTKCTGCHCCYIACKDRHDLPVGVSYRTVAEWEEGKFPQVRRFSLSIACNHCAHPRCEAVCPVGAIRKDDATGLVVQDPSRCIGCERCVESCPYGAPSYNPAAKVSGKCDGCIGELRAGRRPRCVLACSTRALDFGPLADLDARCEGRPAGDAPSFLPEPETGPSLRVIVASEDLLR